MSRIRVCFLGTPSFAVTCLQGLLDDPHFEVVGVVTQPDRPAGRKMVLTPSPVKILAQSYHLPVLSPESINKDLILQDVQNWHAEIAVVVAFGQIVSQKFLDLFPLGCVNVHASVLPRWRGAAPIQRAIEAGDSETGVALQKMVKALDAGDVLGIRKCALDHEITALELHDKLAVLGKDLLAVELMDYARGNLVPSPQDASLVTYAKKIEKSEAQLNWQDSARTLHAKIRALTMGPGTWTSWQTKKLKINRSALSLQDQLTPTNRLPVGGVAEIHQEGLLVQTGTGLLRILEVQPESRNRQKAWDFAKTAQLKVGDRFGEG